MAVFSLYHTDCKHLTCTLQCITTRCAFGLLNFENVSEINSGLTCYSLMYCKIYQRPNTPLDIFLNLLSYQNVSETLGTNIKI